MPEAGRTRIANRVHPLKLALAFVVSATLVYVAIVFAHRRPNYPVLGFSEASYDAGRLRNLVAPEVKHRFLFRNEGNQPLQIFEVKTTCGCTVAELSKKVFGPGEVGNLDVVLSLSD